MADPLARWLAIAALLLLAAGCAALLRWCAGSRQQSPVAGGWAMLGGAIAGVLLGPTIFGRVMPVRYESWFAGGVEQRLARDSIVSRHGADLMAAEHAALSGGGIDLEQLDRMRVDYDREWDEVNALWRQAQWRDQQPLRITTFTIAALLLLCGGRIAVRDRDRRQGWLAPASIGLWAALLPGALAYAAMTAWWGFAPSQAFIVAAACAIGPWALTAIDREAANQAEFGGAGMVQTAGRIASVIAIIAAGYAMWLQRGVEGLLLVSPLLALPVGWLIGLVQSRRSKKSHPQMSQMPQIEIDSSARSASSVDSAGFRFWTFGLWTFLSALLAVKIELFEHFAIWPILVILLLSDDGRWFGAFAGAMLLGGRRALRTTRLVIGAMSAGPTQLALAVLAAHVWAIPETLLLPLLLGCLLIEFTAPARRRFAERLLEMEVQLAKTDE